MNYRALKYRIPNGQSHRANFVSYNLQFRPYSRYPQSRAIYRKSNDPRALNSTFPVEHWDIGWKGANRIRSIFNWILKIGNFIQQRIREKAGAGGCSPACVCVGAAITAVMIVVGIALSIGLGVGLNTDNESVNSTSTGNYTYINVEAFMTYRI